MAKRQFKSEGSDTRIVRHRVTMSVSAHIDADSLHELLCKAVHEGDVKALETLQAHVADIGVK